MGDLKNNLMLLHSDTIEVVRKEINLAGEHEMRQAIDILKEWVGMQPHFKKKHFADAYLERCIVTSKGSLEKAKKSIDKMCTLRTLLPQFFENVDFQEEFGELFDNVQLIMCPKLTKEHYRVLITKAIHNPAGPKQLTLFFKYMIYVAEYHKRFDYNLGFRIIYDLRTLELMKFVSMINIVELRNVLSILMGGYGVRIVSVHFVSTSKAIDLLVNIVKQIVKPKIANRISVHSTFDELVDIIGKEVIPNDLGGLDKSVQEINDAWIQELSLKENKEYICEMNVARTDESLRPKDKFNEEYAGVAGTFRILSVD